MNFIDMNTPHKGKPKKEPVTAIEKVEVAGDLLSKAAAEAGVAIPPEKVGVLRQFLKAAKYGHQATLSMKCTARKCTFIDTCPLHAVEAELPLGKQCHPPGTMILVVDTKYHCRHELRKTSIPIEELDPDRHLIISYSRSKTATRQQNTLRMRGRTFSLHSRKYGGSLITISAGNYSHKCTTDHISIAKWNENAVDKFVVYLMKKGPHFRVGTTKLIWRSRDGKFHSGPRARMRTEAAEGIWLLGVYDTNSEALLAEEYFSTKGQIPKALFVVSEKQNRKWDGLYSWVTQEALDLHHANCSHPLYHYIDFLSSQGLSISKPLMSFKDGKNIGGISSPFEVAACNLLSEIMDVAIFDEEIRTNKKGRWTPISISREYYNGPVYSLDVDDESTYVANNIATHNCPVENALIEQWVSQFVDSLEMDPDDPCSAVEMHMVYELAGMELIRRRAAHELSQRPELIKREIVGWSPQGDPIWDDKPAQALLILERYSKIVNKLRDSLLVTPKSQSQAGQVSRDVSTRTANIMEKTKKLRAERQLGKSIQDADFEVIDEEAREQEQGKGSDPKDESEHNPEDPPAPSP